MTREEAKIILYVYRAVNLVDVSHKEAFDMAIKALGQEPYEGDVIRDCENCKHYGEDLHGANCRFCQNMKFWEVNHG